MLKIDILKFFEKTSKVIFAGWSLACTSGHSSPAWLLWGHAHLPCTRGLFPLNYLHVHSEQSQHLLGHQARTVLPPRSTQSTQSTHIWTWWVVFLTCLIKHPAASRIALDADALLVYDSWCKHDFHACLQSLCSTIMVKYGRETGLEDTFANCRKKSRQLLMSVFTRYDVNTRKTPVTKELVIHNTLASTHTIVSTYLLACWNAFAGLWSANNEWEEECCW